MDVPDKDFVIESLMAIQAVSFSSGILNVSRAEADGLLSKSNYMPLVVITY